MNVSFFHDLSMRDNNHKVTARTYRIAQEAKSSKQASSLVIPQAYMANSYAS
ncbi:hypothetical protein LINPERPRIM_LOCUS6083 [Linum perenne]